MVVGKFFPRETDFFGMFEKAAHNLNRGAKLFVEVEQEGDILTHEVMRRLNKTFLTPVDREDIHALISRVDDVLDLIWAAADRAVLFKLKESTPEVVALSKILLTTTEIVIKAINCLKDKKYSYIQEYCIEINRLENSADSTFRSALATLFENVSDPILVIKWKEVYEHLEDAIDTCEDVADILESIVLKHA
jgi:predicted phosphate transport protein (TIGR00153 family)